MNRHRITRRRALPALALAGCGVWSQAQAAPRSAQQKLRVGAIGVGNRGAYVVADVRREALVEVSAICDVDRTYIEQMLEQLPAARVYRDFRELLDREDLDAVLVSTPDHTHAHAALAAIGRGRHVYCEKPLAHSLDETRRLAEAARRKDVATQMGNQHHSSDGYRRAVQWVRSGVLGAVREVDCWTNRPLWPQGIARPPAKQPPASLDWDLWLGPAPERPFHDGLHPMNWRGWWDFGTGALGDMGPHLLDPVCGALKLTAPVRVAAESSPVSRESAPLWSIVRFDFPARDNLPPVRLHWYDGGKQPPPQRSGYPRLPRNGALLYGERGKMFVPELGRQPVVQMASGNPPPEMPPAAGPPSPSHVAEWLRACRDGGATGANFQDAARLTDLCLLGNIAVRLGGSFRWDSAARRAPDRPQVANLLGRSYRRGWEL